jgi:hypothetical protein
MINLLVGIALIFSLNSSDPIKEELKNKLVASTTCWNSGDMECFMQTYWKSDSLTFIVEGGISYGWESTLQKYKVAFPTAKDRGELSFTFISVNKISEEAYYMIGEYHLKLESGHDNGYFSLLWKKINNDWVIVADHSSN